MLMEDAIQKMSDVAKSQGAEQFDIVGGISESNEISVFEGEVQNVEFSNSQGIGIRLFKNGRPGYAYTEKLSADALEQTVKDAINHTELTDFLTVSLPTTNEFPDIDLKKWNEKLESVTLDDLKTFALNLESRAKDRSEFIVNVPYLGVGKSKNNFYFLNSNGISHVDKSNMISAGLGAVAEKNGVKKMGVYSNGSRDFSQLSFEYMADKSVERALELLEPKSIDHGTYPVIFSNRITSQLFSMFFSPYTAEMVQKGQSRFAGMVGKQIANPMLNIISDPHDLDLPGCRIMDGEGVVSEKLNIVENGVLNSYLYNLETAHKDGRASTGHASRGYSGKVGTSFGNFRIPKGEKSLQDIQRDAGTCFMVTKLEGGSGCSSVSGEISIGAQGFLIENGEIIHAVDEVTLSTNYFDLLKNIDAISNEYNDSYSSVKIPDILVSDVVVSS